MKKRYTKIVSLVLGFGLAASMVAGCSVKSSENVVTTASPTAAKAETTATAESRNRRRWYSGISQSMLRAITL